MRWCGGSWSVRTAVPACRVVVGVAFVCVHSAGRGGRWRCAVIVSTPQDLPSHSGRSRTSAAHSGSALCNLAASQCTPPRANSALTAPPSSHAAAPLCAALRRALAMALSALLVTGHGQWRRGERHSDERKRSRERGPSAGERESPAENDVSITKSSDCEWLTGGLCAHPSARRRVLVTS